MTLRIAFIGTVQFSLSALEEVLATAPSCGAQVVAVIAGAGSMRNADYADLSGICAAHGLPCLRTDDAQDEKSLACLRASRPDIVFCFGWSRLLRKEVLTLAPLGVLGFHPAALPANRGRHPIIWALALGLTETASTFFFMSEAADTGDILSQERVLIAYEDNASSLYAKITAQARKQIRQFLPELSEREFHTRAQNAHYANSWRKRGLDDGRLDFRMGSRALYNLTRALTRPYPGAHVMWQGKPCPVWRLREAGAEPQNLEPGLVVGVEDGVIRVKTYDGAVEILEHDIHPLPQPGSYL